MASPSGNYSVVAAQPEAINLDLADFGVEVPPDVVANIKNAQSFSVRQHVRMFPNKLFACPPCVRQENSYTVYAGMTRDSENEFLRIDEISDDWNRCCCAPFHPLKLEARAVVPTPGTNSDWDNLHKDIVESWNTMSVRERATAYKKFPVLFTMVRDNGMRSLCQGVFPCKLLNTFVCLGCCQDGMKVYAGATPDNTKERGGPVPMSMDRLLGSVEQPILGGGFSPALHLRGEREDRTVQPFAKVEGPCFFGGWSEMCCSFRFFLSRFDSSSKTADLGVIIKQKPRSVTGVVSTLTSTADNYTIILDDQAKLSFSQKVTVITAQVLADYMFFDGSMEWCKSDRKGLTCNFFYCSVLGAVCPCSFHIPFGETPSYMY